MAKGKERRPAPIVEEHKVKILDRRLPGLNLEKVRSHQDLFSGL